MLTIFEIFDKIIENSGHTNTLAGILVVFIGLVLISVAISLFNKASHFFLTLGQKKETDIQIETESTEPVETNEIPEDELVAIATAVEVYRLLHFEILQNEVTFSHGANQTPWKTIQRNRKPVTRVR